MGKVARVLNICPGVAHMRHFCAQSSSASAIIDCNPGAKKQNHTILQVSGHVFNTMRCDFLSLTGQNSAFPNKLPLKQL